MPSAESFNSRQSKIATLSRTYTDDEEYTKPSQFRVGAGGTNPTTESQDLGFIIPIEPGEVLDDIPNTTGWNINSTNEVGINNTLTKTALSALYIEKNDTTDANVVVDKTYSAFDFTDKEFWVFVYISSDMLSKLTSAGLTIRLRQDASNYYEYINAKSLLGSGWNEISFTSDDATVEGTPDIESLTSFYLSFETNDVDDVTGTNDFVIDNLKLITESNKVKNMITGFPNVSAATREAIFRGTLTSVQGVGYNVDRVGWYNTDEEPILWSVDRFPAESKGIADEFNFIRRNIKP